RHAPDPNAKPREEERGAEERGDLSCGSARRIGCRGSRRAPARRSRPHPTQVKADSNTSRWVRDVKLTRTLRSGGSRS
ncbi:unnamed protein product, partial [Urochloa humidicola]